MKLKNKLLPLVGIAAVCATAAPIALTSCKTNNDWVDLMEKYNPTVKALDNQTFTTKQANEAYFGNGNVIGKSWKSDDEVIAQYKDDHLWSSYNYSETNLPKRVSSYTEAKIRFNGFTVKHPTFTPPASSGVDPFEMPSFTFESEYVGVVSYSSSGYTAEIKYDVVNTLVNVPFVVEYSDDITDDDPLWNVVPAVDLMDANDDWDSKVSWSAKEVVTMTTTISYPEEGYENTQTSTHELNCYTGCMEISPYGFFYDMYAPVGAASHYLFSVQNGDGK